MLVDETRHESRAFEADVAKLLNLIVHSVYSDRDVNAASPSARHYCWQGIGGCGTHRYR